MKGNKANRMIEYGVQEIERIVPYSEEIELDVKENGKGHFYSLIKVKVNHKFYIAKKEGKDMYESFHKAMRALKAQLAKNKINHRVERNLHFNIA